MASRLNPYLSFTDNAREALEFYREVFGGTVTLGTYGEMGAASTSDYTDRIMHGILETDAGFTLMGADIPPQMQFQPGNTMSISLSGDDEAEMRGYWDKLSPEGQVAVPLEKQMWGDEFGMCTDRFGVTWMVNISA